MNIFTAYSLVVSLLAVVNYGSAATIFSSADTAQAGSLTKAVVYQVRDAFYSLSDSSVNRATSEHFQIIWGKRDTTGTVNLKFVQGNLANLEAIRSFYIDRLGLRDIGHSQNWDFDGYYKSNVYIAETGLDKIGNDWAYMSVDSDSFGYSVMMPGAMRVDPPSWVVPHELAHVFEFHNGGIIPYVWGEATANFLRNEYLGSEYYSYGGTIYGPTSDFFAPYILNSEVHFPSIKNWYDVWPILLYIDENPDNIFGLGHEALLKLLTYGKEETTYFRAMEIVTGVSIKVILGGLARRMVTVDFKAQKHYLEYLNPLLQTQSNLDKIYTNLTSATGGWLVVPANKAPQQGGYNIIRLGPYYKSASLTINFLGTSTNKEADWRASIVTVTNDGDTRYSSMWNKGNNTVTFLGDEKATYLVVAATPTTMPFIDIDRDGPTYPYRIQISVR